jgi:hypothetical protein
MPVAPGCRPVLACSARTGPSGSESSVDELPHGEALLLTSFELWTRRAPVRVKGLEGLLPHSRSCASGFTERGGLP